MALTMKNDQTKALWEKFIPFLPLLKGRASPDLISMQRFPSGFDMSHFNENTVFHKWAGAEVKSLKDVPEGLEHHVIEEGLYAVFLHRGPAAEFPKTAAFIYGQWLPNSGYVLDDREHFELLPPGYRPDHMEATEEVWIPVRKANKSP